MNKPGKRAADREKRMAKKNARNTRGKIVSAAWKDERIPSVKKKLRINAPLATIPGMMPYIEHI